MNEVLLPLASLIALLGVIVYLLRSEYRDRIDDGSPCDACDAEECTVHECFQIPAGLSKGDLIATIDNRTGQPNDELVHVLEAARPEFNVHMYGEPVPDGTYWEAWVRHLTGYWAGQTMYLLLKPDEFVHLGHESVHEAEQWPARWVTA